MWLLSYGTLITPVPVASPRRGEAAVSAEGQEEEDDEEEEDEDSLMLSKYIKIFAYFILTVIPLCDRNPVPLTPGAQRQSFSTGSRPPSSAQLLFFDAAKLVNVTFL